MKWFQVIVEDHITHARVCVLDMATREEAFTISRCISGYNGCTVYVVETPFLYKKGDSVDG